MISFFEGYKPYVGTKTVTWQLPYEVWFKYNTDGASRGNPGPSSYGFCLRDHAGDLVFAKANEIGETTNIVAEAKSIVEGLKMKVQLTEAMTRSDLDLVQIYQHLISYNGQALQFQQINMKPWFQQHQIISIGAIMISGTDWFVD
nr:uncharacterized protein LOC104117634 [Nicotiana tomentosiformis]